MKGQGILSKLSNFLGEATEQKLRELTLLSNLRQGSVYIHMLYEMINQEFQAQE